MTSNARQYLLLLMIQRGLYVTLNASKIFIVINNINDGVVNEMNATVEKSHFSKVMES